MSDTLSLSAPPVASPTAAVVAGSAADQAFMLLRTVFTVAPIAFGIDKFLGLLVDWEVYLAPLVEDLAPGTDLQLLVVVGVVEILAGLLVAVRPDIGGYVVAAWLGGIVVSLVAWGQHLDVALRDVGLLVAALALARLAQAARAGRRPLVTEGPGA